MRSFAGINIVTASEKADSQIKNSINKLKKQLNVYIYADETKCEMRLLSEK